MANWDDLPADIWRLIFQKVITLISDHIPFSGVCKFWRSIGLEYRTTKFPTNVPALIIPGGTTTTSKTRRLLAFLVGKNISNKENDLPLLSAPHESLCRGSHQGWLVMVDKSMSMYLHNPINGGRPDQPPSRDFPPGGYSLVQVVRRQSYIIDRHPPLLHPQIVLFWFSMVSRGELGLWKVGDHKDWRLIEGPNSWGYIDGTTQFRALIKLETS